jgi:hypothetical protein
MKGPLASAVCSITGEAMDAETLGLNFGNLIIEHTLQYTFLIL